MNKFHKNPRCPSLSSLVHPPHLPSAVSAEPHSPRSVPYFFSPRFPPRHSPNRTQTGHHPANRRKSHPTTRPPQATRTLLSSFSCVSFLDMTKLKTCDKYRQSHSYPQQGKAQRLQIQNILLHKAKNNRNFSRNFHNLNPIGRPHRNPQSKQRDTATAKTTH